MPAAAALSLLSSSNSLPETMDREMTVSEFIEHIPVGHTFVIIENIQTDKGVVATEVQYLKQSKTEYVFQSKEGVMSQKRDDLLPKMESQLGKNSPSQDIIQNKSIRMTKVALIQLFKVSDSVSDQYSVTLNDFLISIPLGHVFIVRGVRYCQKVSGVFVALEGGDRMNMSISQMVETIINIPQNEASSEGNTTISEQWKQGLKGLLRNEGESCDDIMTNTRFGANKLTRFLRIENKPSDYPVNYVEFLQSIPDGHTLEVKGITYWKQSGGSFVMIQKTDKPFKTEPDMQAILLRQMYGDMPDLDARIISVSRNQLFRKFNVSESPTMYHDIPKTSMVTKVITATVLASLLGLAAYKLGCDTNHNNNTQVVKPQ